MVKQDGDPAVWIEAEEPVFLLFVGHDIAGKKGYQSGFGLFGVLSLNLRMDYRGQKYTYMRVCVHSVP